MRCKYALCYKSWFSLDRAKIFSPSSFSFRLSCTHGTIIIRDKWDLFPETFYFFFGKFEEKAPVKDRSLSSFLLSLFFFFLFLLALHFHLLIIALSCVTEMLMESGRLTPSCLDQCNMTGGAFWPGIFRLWYYGLLLPHWDTSLSGPNQIALAAYVCVRECVCVCVKRCGGASQGKWKRMSVSLTCFSRRSLVTLKDALRCVGRSVCSCVCGAFLPPVLCF